MSQRKKRVKIPGKIEAEVLFLSDHTCCVCQDRSKPVQIHHVNEDPSDNRPENLAVVCLECSEKIHRKGTVSKGYSPAEVTHYKTLWEESVAERRRYLALPTVKEKVREIHRSTGVERYIEREVPYLDGLALKAFEVSPPLRLPEHKERTLEEARRITATRGDADRLLVIAARIKGGEITDATDEMILSRVSLAIGDAKFHAADYGGAETSYQEALGYAESADEAGIVEICRYELGAAVGMQGRHQEALEHLDTVIELSGDNSGAWYNRGICLLALNRPGEAMSACRKAIELGEEVGAWHVVARAHLNMGVAQARVGILEEAIDSYTEAVEAGAEAEEWGTVARAYYNMGTAHEVLGQHEEAIESCLKAIDVGSKAEDWSTVASAYGNTGAAQVQLGRPEEAIESYERAVETGNRAGEWSAIAQAHNGIGFAHLELGKHQQALKSYHKAIEVGSKGKRWNTVALAYFNMGTVHSKLGRLDEAIKSYENTIQIGSKGRYWAPVAKGYYNVGIAQTKLGRYEEAIEAYEKAIEIGSEAEDWDTVASAYNNMAAAQGGLGMYAEVINSCQNAIEIGRKAEDWHTVVRAHCSMGNAQAGLGKHEEAIDSFTKALPVREFLPDAGRWVFTSIAASSCVLGMEALLDENLARARDHADLIAEAHWDAQQSGMGQLVLDALETFESSLPKGDHKAFKRFKQLVMECSEDPSE